jgi:hypothetical protein
MVLPAVRLETNFRQNAQQGNLPKLPEFIFAKIEFAIDPLRVLEIPGEHAGC